MDCRVITELAATEKSNVVSERRCKIRGVGERARSHPSSTFTSKQGLNIQRDVGETDDMQKGEWAKYEVEERCWKTSAD